MLANPTPPLPTEKRKHPRLVVHIPAIYRSPTLTTDAYVSNISQSGLFISCRPDAVGTVGEIVLSLPGFASPVPLRGRVIWVRLSPQAGMGFLFQDVPRQHRVVLANFLIARFCAS